MNKIPDEPTDIQTFYRNSTIFLTGVTGFVGKLVLEKILRSLPIKKIFVLVRKKNEISGTKRLQDIFESPVFDLIKNKSHGLLEKVFIMKGDCSLPMLGLSEEDQNIFIEQVDTVFHVAASIKFNENIKTTTFTNVRATRDLIILAQRALKIQTFVYVGTAYSNCPKSEIKEKIYESTITAENLITACEVLDDECVDYITKKLIGKSPNTYTFGKQVTENYINRKGRNIPICIVRPAIVVSTMSEPMPAFIDNFYGVAGFVLANTSGLNRILYYKKINLDIVPADIVVNVCIAAGWQTGESFKPYNSEVPIYHVSSNADNPVALDQICVLTNHYMRQVPSKKLLVMYPLIYRTTSKYNCLFWRLIFHNLAAYIFDFVLRLQGKKPEFVKAIRKLHKFQDSFDWFVTHSVFLHMNNTHQMLKKMSLKDSKLFNCDITTVNWKHYFAQYAKGLRVYVLKDPLETIPEGQKHYNKLRSMFVCIFVAASFLLYAIKYAIN